MYVCYQKHSNIRICLINLEFSKFFWWTLSNSIQLYPILSRFLSFSLCVICIHGFYSIKSSHFAKTKIYVKLDPKGGTIYPQ